MSISNLSVVAPASYHESICWECDFEYNDAEWNLTYSLGGRAVLSFESDDEEGEHSDRSGPIFKAVESLVRATYGELDDYADCEDLLEALKVAADSVI